MSWCKVTKVCQGCPHYPRLDLVTQSHPILCNPTDCSPPGSSVHGILQERILEWVAISYFRGIFPTQGSNSLCRIPRIPCVSCTAGRVFTHWAIEEAQVPIKCHYLRETSPDALGLLASPTTCCLPHPKLPHHTWKAAVQHLTSSLDSTRVEP